MRGLEHRPLFISAAETWLTCGFVAHTRPRPQVSQDLFERYGLNDLAAEVARVLPNGEKNALRKTYKGHIKKLGVQGHFDKVTQDPARPDGLIALIRCPADVWDAHHIRGKSALGGISNEMGKSLTKAVTMAKGFVPKSLWDSSVLGELGPVKGENRASSARPTAPNTPLPSAGLSGLPRARVGTPLAQDAARSKRNIKKRGYGESSFEGYGDGFPDDDLSAETGYSTGEGEMISKRRKQVPINSYSV